MSHKRLIFFADHGDTSRNRPVWTAYHFALEAHRASLDVEIRLAADAIEIFKRERPIVTKHFDDLGRSMCEAADRGLMVSVPHVSEALAGYMHEAADRGVFVSVCDGCATRQNLTDADLKRWGAVRRLLKDILTEVADGRSELIYLG